MFKKNCEEEEENIREKAEMAKGKFKKFLDYLKRKYRDSDQKTQKIIIGIVSAIIAFIIGSVIGIKKVMNKKSKSNNNKS